MESAMLSDDQSQTGTSQSEGGDTGDSQTVNVEEEAKRTKKVLGIPVVGSRT
jgi:hypothetical protein